MMKLFVGLGNPGEEYEDTRHSVGREFLIRAIFERGSVFDRDKYARALVAESDGDLFALPETFMNKSGEAVRALSDKRDIPPENIMIAHDDIDIPIGRFKISFGRGNGGHNGVESVISSLGTPDFARLRIGICPIDEAGEKKKPDKDIVRSFVLKPLTAREIDYIQEITPHMLQALDVFSKEGIEAAMNRFN